MNQNRQNVKYYSRLLTGEMVRAVLAGHKTATRWPLRRQPVEDVSKRKGEWVWEDVDGNIFPAPVRPGDVIWVRETWSQDDPSLPPIYRADGRDMPGKWKPAIHMPRRVARLFLSVTEVGLARIQDITETDAQAEGVSARRDFRALWNGLYGKSAYGWNANPYVWGVRFQRLPEGTVEGEATEVRHG